MRCISFFLVSQGGGGLTSNPLPLATPLNKVKYSHSFFHSKCKSIKIIKRHFCAFAKLKLEYDENTMKIVVLQKCNTCCAHNILILFDSILSLFKWGGQADPPPPRGSVERKKQGGQKKKQGVQPPTPPANRTLTLRDNKFFCFT